MNDNTNYVPRGQDGHDALFKIRPVVDRLQQTFRENYDPGRELSMDEGTCGWKGRLAFCTYNKNKPNKWGIKLFEVCDANNGYCTDFDVYTGLQVAETHGKTHETVMKYWTGTSTRDIPYTWIDTIPVPHYTCLS